MTSETNTLSDNKTQGNKSTYEDGVKKTDKDKLSAISPVTGKVLSQYVIDDLGSTQKKLKTAQNAQQAWSSLSLKERVTVLRKVRNEFAASSDKIIKALSAEIARPEAESWFAEIISNVELFDYWLSNGGQFIQTEKLKLNPLNYPGKQARIEYLPKGVIGLITPWNFPVAIALRSIVPALLAGNAILWKPSEWSAEVGQVLFNILKLHLPEGLINIVHGLGDAGAAVVECSDLVIFTGSVATGRIIEKRCLERDIHCALELGGKDAAYVAEDASLDRTVAGLVWGAFNNCGQNCASVERIYIHESIYDQFEKKFVKSLEELLNHDYPQVGPVVNPKQAELVLGHISQAKNSGANILSGGQSSGLFIEPTVLANTNAEMDVIKNESFGPLAPLIKVKNFDEALEQINSSQYGLTCSLWTQNYDWVETVKNQINTGVLTVNNHGFSAAIPNAPWLGVMDSGSGITNSHLAIREMVRPRMVLIDKNKAERETWWYPYNENAVDLAKTLLKTLQPGFKSPLLFIKLLGLLGKRWK